MTNNGLRVTRKAAVTETRKAYDALVSQAKRPSKYGARAVTILGERFHSVGEYRRYGELVALGFGSGITKLARQVKYDLHAPDGTRIGSYIADFTYEENGMQITEDFKGFLTPLAKWMLKHFEAEYSTKIRLTGTSHRKRAA